MSTRWFDARSEEQRKEYSQRFVKIAAEGHDIDGEGRFVDAMAGRGSRILDAGCGAGRVTDYLRRCGHRAVGVDVDPLLIEAGHEQHPQADLRVLDLADLSPELGSFDVIVCPGNVITFVASGTEPQILAAMATVLAPGGRVVFGFHLDRTLSVADLDGWGEELGWRLEHRFGTWELDPFTDESDWAVSVYRG
ncbi:class I SAM-dependent methyltransferase [Nocardioides sp. JQ2195]|uniref:class I SAM-dependent methyltransferase n=1 Tax=Nocardioides sp. JQ2195 TaxID=2592334 RepID=UPI00143EE8C7|nr:class I SAM-dependent methyltransferase [Nocardioides sp. JQ2195]QIX25228.1 class I SAM-dependent methyltransferase [Nocardioides sp. JQ2195]